MSSFDFTSLPTIVRDQIYHLLLPSPRRFWVKKRVFHPSPEHAIGPQAFGSPQTFRRMQKYQLQAMALSHWDVPEFNYGLRTGDDAAGFPALLALRLVSRSLADEVDRFLHGQCTLWLCFNDAVRSFVDTVLGVPGELPVLAQVPEAEVADLADMKSWRGLGLPVLTSEVWEAHVWKLQAGNGLLRWVSRFRHVHVLVEERFVPRLGDLARVLAGAREEHALFRPCLHFTICGFKDYFKTYLSNAELYLSYGDGKLPESLYALCAANSQAQEKDAVPSSDADTPSTTPRLIFETIKQDGATDQWCQRHPFDPTHRFLMEDYIFYKIDWTADIASENPPPGSSKADTQSDSHKSIDSPVKGSYINFARPGTMKALLGWEPPIPGTQA